MVYKPLNPKNQFLFELLCDMTIVSQLLRRRIKARSQVSNIAINITDTNDLTHNSLEHQGPEKSSNTYGLFTYKTEDQPN